jgi:hypothetical protein
MWHFLETRDESCPVDNRRYLVETSVDYYPVAHNRHLGVHSRVIRKATSPSPSVYSNQFVTVNQRSTRITLK